MCLACVLMLQLRDGNQAMNRLSRQVVETGHGLERLAHGHAARRQHRRGHPAARRPARLRSP